MKIRNLLVFAAFLLFTLSLNQVNAQLVKDVSITAEKADFQLIAPNSYLLEIGGANGYYFKKEVPHTNRISIDNIKADGKKFADGSYMMQITPIFKLTDEERKELRALQADNKIEEIAAFRKSHGLPDQVDVHNINFSIRNGLFVAPEQKEARALTLPSMSGVWQQDHPALYASLNNNSLDYGSQTAINGEIPARDNSSAEDAQVFATDLIVQGSACVGFDCVSSESFGFDTGRYKENNLRVHFNDTSSSASFPGNDWRITINDSSNGGANYFAIEDATSGRIPFRLEAGAPANALYVDDAGNIGIGTASPIVETHIADGDSPTLRLEQNGSSGFGSQTWDIAGNETNFFIRDVTNGSLLPFRIKPSAPKNSIFIDSDGDIGLGTENPSNRLQLESGDMYIKAGSLGINLVPTVPFDLLGDMKVEGNTLYNGTSTYRGDVSFFLSNNATFYSNMTAPSPFQVALHINPSTTQVGIGTNAPGHLLELSADDAAKPNGGSWTAASDRRLKTNIVDFNEGLEAIMKIRPVSYNYNGKLGYPTEKTFIGIIAQEMEEIAPYTVKKLNKPAPEGEEDYLAFDGTPVTYMIINAVQEQQEIINAQKEEIAQLKSELAALNELQSQVAALSQMVSTLSEAGDTGDKGDTEMTGEKE